MPLQLANADNTDGYHFLFMSGQPSGLHDNVEMPVKV